MDSFTTTADYYGTEADMQIAFGPTVTDLYNNANPPAVPMNTMLVYPPTTVNLPEIASVTPSASTDGAVPPPPPFPVDVKKKRAYHKKTPEEKIEEQRQKDAKKREREIEKARKKAEKEANKKSSASAEDRAFNKLKKLRANQISQEEKTALFRKKMTFLEKQMEEFEAKLTESENKEDELHNQYVDMADEFEADFETDPDDKLPKIPKIPKKSLVGFKLDDKNFCGELVDIDNDTCVVQVLEIDGGKVKTTEQKVQMSMEDLTVVG